MSYLGQIPQSNFVTKQSQTFTPDGSTTSFSLNFSVNSGVDIILVINNVIQESGGGKAFTATGTTLTMSVAPASGDSMYCIFLGLALQTINPGANSVGTSQLSATGTKDATTFLRGDNTFAGAGKVLQVVSATDSTQRTTTSSSFVTASNTLSVDITPSSTSSKIFIICNTSFGTDTANAQAEVTLYRDSTNLGTAQGLMSNILITSGTSIRTPGTMTILDSPSSTSQITYQPYFKAAGGTLQLNWNNTKSSITAFEVGA
jgi:hypothetical protein